MGERTPLAVLDAPASGRMAMGEALTNLLAAPIGRLAAREAQRPTGWPPAAPAGEDARAVRHRATPSGLELCPALGMGIPVGKDSLSMRTALARRGGQPQQVIAPVSLIVYRLRHRWTTCAARSRRS
jgi:phosphoribosylformylglycinamidine synthase